MLLPIAKPYLPLILIFLTHSPLHLVLEAIPRQTKQKSSTLTFNDPFKSLTKLLQIRRFSNGLECIVDGLALSQPKFKLHLLWLHMEMPQGKHQFTKWMRDLNQTQTLTTYSGTELFYFKHNMESASGQWITKRGQAASSR